MAEVKLEGDHSMDTDPEAAHPEENEDVTVTECS